MVVIVGVHFLWKPWNSSLVSNIRTWFLRLRPLLFLWCQAFWQSWFLTGVQRSDWFSAVFFCWPGLVFQIWGSLGFRVSFHVEHHHHHVVSLWKLNTKFILPQGGGFVLLDFPKVKTARPSAKSRIAKGRARWPRSDQIKNLEICWSTFVGVLVGQKFLPTHALCNLCVGYR